MPWSPKKRQTYQELASRNRSGDPFYSSAAWRALRAAKLAIDPLCEQCTNEGRVTEATEVHHKQRRRDFPELALEISNLECLCKSHHSQETRREMQAERR